MILLAELKRVLGFWEATLAGVGVILGAGIYALLGAGVGMAGNGVWLSLVVGAVLAALTGLSYAELSSMMPKAGAEFSYAEKAFGKKTAFLTGWLFVVSGIVGCTTVALGFGGYLHALAGVPIWLAAVAVLGASTFLLLLGVKDSVLLAVVFTLVEAGGLVLVVLLAVPFYGSVDLLSFPGWGGVLGAAALMFFAFLGFEDVAKLAEETRNACVVIPRALLASIAISAVFYVLVAVASLALVGVGGLSGSSAPLAVVAGKALGGNGFLLLSVIALFATSNTVVLLELATSRVVYGMARASCLPSRLSVVSKQGVPWLATVVVGFIAALFVFAGDVAFAAKITDFAVFVVFFVVNAAVVRLRFLVPGARRPFRVWGSVAGVPVAPVAGAFSCLVLLASLGWEAVVGGFVLVLVGAAVFFVLRWQ